MNADRFLITAADIIEAARHRLRKWSPEQIEAGIAALARQNVPHAANAPSVMLADRRDLFSASCALLVLLANARGDAALLFQAGYGVVESYRQAQRAMKPRRNDALNELIRQYLDEMPDIGPKKLWDDFCERAEDDHTVIADFNKDDEELLYEPARGAEAIPIRFEGFRKRVQIIRNSLRAHIPDCETAGSPRTRCFTLTSNG